MKKLGSTLLLVAILGYLGSYNGKLCMFNESKTKPVCIFPYSVAIFPLNDQAMLYKGIPYGNREELNRLMEDFLS